MPNKTNEYIHAPLANLDYGFDWSQWLMQGETISISSWTISGGLVKSQEQNLLGVTSVFISGGVSGTIYKLTNSITTSVSGGVTRTDSRTISLSCKDR